MWFDKEIDLQQEQALKYAALGTSFYSPAENNGKLYIIPTGLGNQKDTKKVISIDKETLDIEEYPFSNIALNHMASIDENVYAVNTFNWESYLELYNTKTGKNKTVKLSEVYMYSIIAVDNKLFAFITDDLDTEKGKVRINVYSQDLQLLNEIDISDYGVPTRKFCEDDTYLYVTIDLTTDDIPTGKILKINKQNYDIEEIIIKEDYAYDIYRYNNKFLITHYNAVLDYGSKVTVLDCDGNETCFDLGTDLTLTGILEDKFVVANETCLRLYSLKNFELIKEYKLDISSKLYKFYVSGLLFVD